MTRGSTFDVDSVTGGSDTSTGMGTVSPFRAPHLNVTAKR
jgi:hypothetical protein